jgi:putative nucleotidyltransferase with HDIG domain
VEKHKKVLLVEKNQRIRSQIIEFLKKQKIQIEEVSSADMIMGRLNHTDGFALLILDFDNSQTNNIEILRSIRDLDQHMDICILGLDKKPDLAVSLLNNGIIDHVGSISNIAGLYAAAINAIEKRHLVNDNLIFNQRLKQLRTEQKINQRHASDLEEIYDSTLENLMTALDIRDVETFGHSKTVAKYSQVLAQILGINDEQKLDNIRKGALLHDIGKIAIPDSILKKPGSLSPEEWIKIRLHPSLGFGLIKEIKLVEEIGNIILYHHERYDGTGYPGRKKKDQIPLEARIFSLADALDAITSHRPYRPRKSFSFAREEILNNSGSQFDPVIVNAFNSLDLKKWEKIRFETTTLLPSFEEMLKLFK